MESAKCIIEVHGGIIPEQVISEYSRRWVLSSDQARDPETFLDIQGTAMNYALSIQDPNRLNWVRLDWVWL